MSLTDDVDQVRALASLEGDTPLLTQAIIRVMANMALAIDLLEAEREGPPDSI